MPTPKPTPKRKVGGQKGNLNGLKNGHGLGKRLKRLTVGGLPKPMITVQREGRTYRRNLEAAVIAARGEVNFTDAHTVDTAAAATIQAGICRWLLRNRIDDMSAAEIRGCTADIVKAKEKRDAAVKALKIDREPEAPWVFDGNVK